MATNEGPRPIREMLALIALLTIPALPYDLSFRDGYLILTFSRCADGAAFANTTSGQVVLTQPAYDLENLTTYRWEVYRWHGWKVSVYAHEPRVEPPAVLAEATAVELRTLISGAGTGR